MGLLDWFAEGGIYMLPVALLGIAGLAVAAALGLRRSFALITALICCAACVVALGMLLTAAGFTELLAALSSAELSSMTEDQRSAFLYAGCAIALRPLELAIGFLAAQCCAGSLAIFVAVNWPRRVETAKSPRLTDSMAG